MLVRSIWRAEVTLRSWAPEHEIPFRRTVPASNLAGQLWMESGAEPIYARAARSGADLSGVVIVRRALVASFAARTVILAVRGTLVPRPD